MLESKLKETDVVELQIGVGPVRRTERRGPWRALVGCVLGMLVAPPVVPQAFPFVSFSLGDGLAGAVVHTLFEDSRGLLWIGTAEGLSRYDGIDFVSYTSRDGLPHRRVLALAEDSEGRLWVGTQRGLATFDGQRITAVEAPPELSTSPVPALAAGVGGGLWIASDGAGVWHYDGRTLAPLPRAPTAAGNRVSALAVDLAGRLWLGTGDGVWTYSDGALRRHPALGSYDGRRLTALHLDGSSRLWLAGEGVGVGVLDGRQLKRPDAAAALTEPADAIAHDASGHVWLGTRGGGAARYDGESLRRMGRREGLPGLSVQALLVDSAGNLWLGTNGAGISQLAAEVASPPRVYITDARPLDGDAATSPPPGFQAPADLELVRHRPDLVFELLGLDLRDPSGVRYQYRLEGFERGFSPPTAQRRVTYHDLPPGSYTFEVYAQTRDGLRSDAPARLAVTVRPPLWRRGWLHLAVALAAALAVALAAARRARRRRDPSPRAAPSSAPAGLAQERYEAIVETAGELIYQLDPEHCLSFANRSFRQRLLEDANEELTGTNILRFVDPKQHDEVLAAFAQLRHGTQQHSYVEFRARAGGGRRLWLGQDARRVELDGAFSGFQAVARDVTEHRRLGRNLKRAKKAAELASQSKSDFLANMSHELRTPLNGVIGMTSLLGQTPLTGDQRELANTIHLSGEALLAIIDDVLDFSKIESGMMEIERKPFAVREVLDESVQLLVGSARGKGLSLFSTMAENVPEHVVGDSTRLRQVLINLVGNAVKFTDRGEVEIAARLDAELADGVRLELSVRDTGIGIPEHQREKLFKAFSQVDVSVTRQYGGSGLGLAISAELVSLMGGEIWVESRVDHGSTFFFTVEVPLATGHEDRPPPAAQSSQSVPRPCSDGPPSCLVAEDNPVNQMVTVKQLESLGYRPDVVANGAEAVEAWQTRRYDVVLMDCQMPELDGYEATAHIRRLEGEQRGTRIIALTANATRGVREACLEAGMDDYIRKPVTLKRLSDVLAHWAGIEPPEDPETTPP